MIAASEIDWSECPIVQHDPQKLHGAPNVNGLRITPEAIVDNFEAGLTVSEIHDQFPGVPARDIRTVLNYAVRRGHLSRPVR